MAVVSAVAFVVLLLVVAWRFEDTLLGAAPVLVCAVGLVLYVLAFFRQLSLIDWLLPAAAVAAVALSIPAGRRAGGKALGGQVKRLLLDPHLWVCVAILAAMCLCLRGEQILEWDGYNFWGPDTKSLFFRDGFAPQFSNVASRFGDYTPMPQLIWWWFAHLMGSYQERWLFMAYYIFGALMLFAVADRFRAAKRPWNIVMAVLACAGAVVLPGVACTSWFRALLVDPLMAMLFGLILSLTVCGGRGRTRYWKGKLLICLVTLTLIKSIGILWAVLALLFYALWRWRERGTASFSLLCAGGILAVRGSWWLFCTLTQRSTALVSAFPAAAAQRLQELREGVFLTAGNNRGYLVSYAKAFLFTPIHREDTLAVDLSPAVLVLLLFAGAVLLWRLGFVPKGKGGRLLVFMALTLGVIYTVLMVGQLTMFYTETRYLDPVSAVTLMTRYCAPAHMGLLLLLVTFASGRAEDCAPCARLGARRAAALGVTAALIFSCGAYAEMGRRFVYDPLDEQRISLRASHCRQYEDFLSSLGPVTLEEERGRVLLCINGVNLNPIVINEASPVSIWPLTLTGDWEEDLAAIGRELEQTHAGYLYVDAWDDELARALAAETGQPVETGVLYRVTRTGPLGLERAE